MTLVVLAVLAVSPWQSLDAGTRAAQLDALKALPLEARVVAASEGFLGTRYALSPLGEGGGHDPDPRLRYDAADCLTMVESSMALALAPDEAQVLEVLDRIRYEGAPSYEGRLHVMEAQWLPVNCARGLLEDVTRLYGKDATRRVSKRITGKTWAEPASRALALPESAQPRGEFFLDVVPSALAPRVLAVAPEGLVVVVVRADRPRLVSRVTHVGVLVHKPGGPFLRHASRSFKRVVDEPVEKYLQRNLEFGAWTVEGVALYRVRAPEWLDAGVRPLAPAEALDSDAARAGPASDAGAPPASAPGLQTATTPPDASVEARPSAGAPQPACGCSTDAAALPLGLALLTALRVHRRRRAA